MGGFDFSLIQEDKERDRKKKLQLRFFLKICSVITNVLIHLVPYFSVLSKRAKLCVKFASANFTVSFGVLWILYIQYLGEIMALSVQKILYRTNMKKNQFGCKYVRTFSKQKLNDGL